MRQRSRGPVYIECVDFECGGALDLEIAARASAFDLLGDVLRCEPAGGGQLALARGLDLGGDGEGDGLGAVASEIEADRGVDAGAAGGDGLAAEGRGFGDEQSCAVAGAEDSEVAVRWSGEHGCEAVSILLVAVGHENDGVLWADSQRLDAVPGFTQGKHCVGLREAVAAGEVGAAIRDDDVPAEERGHTCDGARVVSRAEEDEALRSFEVFGKDGFSRVGMGYGFMRQGFAAKEDFASGIEDGSAEGAGRGGKPGMDDGLSAGEGGLHGGEQGTGFRGVGALEEEVDGTSAAEAVGDIGGVVEHGGIALDDGPVADHPEGLSRDLRLEAASADGSGVGAVGAEEEMRSGAAVAGSFDTDERDENLRVAGEVKFDDASAFQHDFSPGHGMQNGLGPVQTVARRTPGSLGRLSPHFISLSVSPPALTLPRPRDGSWGVSGIICLRLLLSSTSGRRRWSDR